MDHDAFFDTFAETLSARPWWMIVVIFWGTPLIEHLKLKLVTIFYTLQQY